MKSNTIMQVKQESLLYVHLLPHSYITLSSSKEAIFHSIYKFNSQHLWQLAIIYLYTEKLDP